ncbi:MAG: RNA polymerase sigma factor [Polyangiaceae bacterium]|jgi:RNA polymerase sigma-70 factor, ECF subfamily
MTLPFLMTAMPATAGPGVEANAGSGATAAALPSFRSIYDAYFDFVWASTRRLGVPVDAADDVVQEIFVVVNARLGTVEQPASLRSWIYGVVRRTVSTYHRGRRVRSANESHDPLEDLASAAQPSPLDLTVLSDEVRLLWRLLGELGPLKREVFVLSEIEEMTMPEIAEAIGVPLNTAYSRLRVAREEFNEALARHEAAQKERR